MRCPDLRCDRLMLETTDIQFDCPRCHARVTFSTDDTLAMLAERRQNEATRFEASFPSLRDGFAAWRRNDAYYTKQGYRLKSNKGRIAPWSKVARKFYPDCSDFHEAAHAVVRA